jgi:hypothetical protein
MTKQKKTKKTPRLPAFLVDLATPISIDLESGEQLKFPRSGNYCLGSNRSGTEIWILPRTGAKTIQVTDKKGEHLYESFTGFEHSAVAKLVSISVANMIKIGRATNIVYRSDKFSKPGNKSDYIHPFDEYPVVSVDNRSHMSVVALRGGRIKIKKEGITG